MPKSMTEVKPGRTLGISLAILASVMLFTLFPFLQLAMLLIINNRLQFVDLPVPGQEDTVTPLEVGGDITGIASAGLVVQAAVGAAYLVIAFLAWRGRPSWIRFAMIATVIVMTVLTVVLSLTPLFGQQELSQGIDSGEALRRVLLSGQLLLSVLVALYVVWYMNRGPARAYFRGYYLSDPNETATATTRR